MKDRLIEVCAECDRASCWYGEFMCDEARYATTKLVLKSELKKMKLEHPSYWSDKKLIEVYGQIPER
jgi:hypothetical protein